MSQKSVVETLKPTDATFDVTSHYRLVLILGAVAYPLWQPILTASVPNAVDPLWPRLLVSALGLLVLALARLRLIGPVWFARLFNVCCFVLTAHYLALVGGNDMHPRYVEGVIVVVASVSACLTTIRVLVTYLIFASFLAIGTSGFDVRSGGSLHFVALISTSVLVLLPALALRLKLTRRLATTASALDRIVGNAAAGIAYVDARGRLVHVNPRAAESLGYSVEALTGMSLLDLTLADDLDRTAARIRSLFSGEVKDLRFDQRMQAADGGVAWMRLYGNPVTGDAGKVEGMIAVVIDVTKEKHLEFILNGQQRLLEMIAGGSTEDDVLRAVCEFVHIHLDNLGCAVLALDEAQTNVRPIASLGVHPALLAKLSGASTSGLAAISGAAAAAFNLTAALANDPDPRWTRLFDAAAPLGIRAVFAAPVIARSGSVLGTFELFCEEARQPTAYEAKMAQAFAEIIGLTMEKTRTDGLIEAQKMKITASAKMASLGEMAAGIAHEINNPMTIVLGRTFMIRKLANAATPEVAEQIAASCSSIEATVKRVTKIIQGLKTFARSDDGDKKQDASVASLLSETMSFCSERFKNHGVTLNLGQVPPELLVACRPTQISQVLLNLLNNAFDAVCDDKNSWVRIEVTRVGDTVEIAVVDSGDGISPETREKMFQPFFSTKEVGKGTGLGLSISLGIVKDHGGTLVMDEGAPNTRFVVTLPLSAEGTANIAA